MRGPLFVVVFFVAIGMRVFVFEVEWRSAFFCAPVRRDFFGVFSG